MPLKPFAHQRRSVRLQEYDYSLPGLYFVTICTHHRRCLFGKIISDAMRLNATGHMVAEQWCALPRRFEQIALDEFIVMPNHIHGIIKIIDTENDPLAIEQISQNRRGDPCGRPKSRQSAKNRVPLGNIVGAFKSLCVYRLKQRAKQNTPDRMTGRLWQRNYWEHVIRGDEDLMRVREYIQYNPMQWKWDSLNPHKFPDERKGLGDRKGRPYGDI